LSSHGLAVGGTLLPQLAELLHDRFEDRAVAGKNYAAAWWGG
jgi:hypothetical protein